MKQTRIFLFLFGLLSVGSVPAQNLYFPPLAGQTWATLSPASLGWCQPELDSLIDYLGARNTRAFIVLKDGKIVVEQYYGTFTQDSLWYWASAGKTLTACAVGIAKHQGYLSLSDTTASIIGQGWTSCTSSQEAKITLRDQLCMTSGLDDAVPDPYCTLPSCLQYSADAGTRWAYHNAPYTLLDTVIEASTGMALNPFLNQNLLQPIGMNGLFIPNGYNNVFVSNARSMARFGLMILAGGVWNGDTIIADTAYFRQMLNTSQSLNLSYGYLWWLNGKASFRLPGSQLNFPGYFNPNAPADMVAAMGKNGQLINVVPSMNLVWLRMGDAPLQGEVPFTINDTIWQHLNAAMCSITSTGHSPEVNRNARVYPQPASEGCVLEWTGTDATTAELTDVNGRCVRRLDVSPGENRFSVSELPAGLYLLRIEGTVLRLMVED